MADPLSVTAAVVGFTTAAIQATKSLHEAVKRFKDRDKTRRRLQDELFDLLVILEKLEEVNFDETPVFQLLKGPVGRCSQECRDFEQSMEAFSKNSKSTFRDWAKMEFKRGDINEFIDSIASYKATISVGLGIVTMHASKVTQQVVDEYNEFVKDTVYILQVQLERIDQRLDRLTTDNNATPGIRVNLSNERDVTEQCLQICEEAKTYIQSLRSRESPLLQEAQRGPDEDDVTVFYEAQRSTRRVFDENLEKFTRTIDNLQKALDSQAQASSQPDEQRRRFQEDISISKQCLEVCKLASEMSNKKIYRVGEVVAEDNSDQVVVTTLADLFDVKKALSKGNSAQLVGSMTAESLRDLTEKRYKSRFGLPAGGSGLAHAESGSSSAIQAQQSKPAIPLQPDSIEEVSIPESRQRPFSNETRKRGKHNGTEQWPHE